MLVEEDPSKIISQGDRATMSLRRCLLCNCSDVGLGMEVELDRERLCAVWCPTAEADTVLVYWDRWTLAEVKDWCF